MPRSKKCDFLQMKRNLTDDIIEYPASSEILLEADNSHDQ